MYDALERTYMSKQGEFLNTAGRTWQKRIQLKGPTIASLRQTEHQKRTLWKYNTYYILFILFRGQRTGCGRWFSISTIYHGELNSSGQACCRCLCHLLGSTLCVCFGGLFACSEIVSHYVALDNLGLEM